jgi:hypothetical protein
MDKKPKPMDWADHYRSLGPGIRYEDPDDNRHQPPKPPTPQSLLDRLVIWLEKLVTP